MKKIKLDKCFKFIPLVIGLVILIVFLVFAIQGEMRYKAAINLFNEGISPEETINIFTEFGNYKKSPKYVEAAEQKLAEAKVTRILDYLNEMNQTHAISYDDYSTLYDMTTDLAD